MEQTCNTPRPDYAGFTSAEQFYDYVKANPEAAANLTPAQTVELVLNIERSTRQNEKNGSKNAKNDARKREENGKVGPGSPPVEHRFKKGNPGGPGRPKGPKSMRRIIRKAIFTDIGGTVANAIVATLIQQALKGNTHAIRIVCENGNNRRKR